MPGIDYRRLREQLSMAEVLGWVGFQTTRRRGAQLRGVCPIPGCPSASRRAFSAHLVRQIYHCFACGSHGNPLDLWSAVRRLPLHQAALDLCQVANLDPPWLPASPAPTPHSPLSVPSRAPSRNH